MSERLWFQSSVEGLFVRGAGSAMTTSLAARLAAIGIDLNALAPAYPADVMTEAIRLTVAELFTERPSAEGQRELGACSCVASGRPSSVRRWCSS
jgi:uncharacterized protein (TIGR02265 family)